MKRSSLPRRSPLRRRSLARRRERVSRYQRRERDWPYMAFVKTLPCFALATVAGHVCEGPVEADHAGRRPLGRKCADDETIPLCSGAHRDRHAFSGPFKAWNRARMRAWLDDGVAATKELAARAFHAW